MDIINKKVVICMESSFPYLTKNRHYVICDETKHGYYIQHDNNNVAWYRKTLFKEHSFKTYNLWI